MVSYVPSITTFYQNEYYTNRDQTEARVLSQCNLAGARNCKTGRKHCWLCSGKPEMVAPC